MSTQRIFSPGLLAALLIGAFLLLDTPGLVRPSQAAEPERLLCLAEVVNGEILDPPDNPEDWPYATVSDAIRDGWRVVKFPELALLLDEDKTYGLGCEFILEK